MREKWVLHLQWVETGQSDWCVSGRGHNDGWLCWKQTEVPSLRWLTSVCFTSCEKIQTMEFDTHIYFLRFWRLIWFKLQLRRRRHRHQGNSSTVSAAHQSARCLFFSFWIYVLAGWLLACLLGSAKLFQTSTELSESMKRIEYFSFEYFFLWKIFLKNDENVIYIFILYTVYMFRSLNAPLFFNLNVIPKPHSGLFTQACVCMCVCVFQCIHSLIKACSSMC